MCPLSFLSVYGCPLAKKRKALEKQPLEPAAKRRSFLTSCPGEEEEARAYACYENEVMEVGDMEKEQGEVVEEDVEEEEREGDEEEDGEVEDEFSEDNEEQGEEEEEEEEVEVERADTKVGGEQAEEEEEDEEGMDEEEEEVDDGDDEEEGEEDEQEDEEEEEQNHQQSEFAVFPVGRLFDSFISIDPQMFSASNNKMFKSNKKCFLIHY